MNTFCGYFNQGICRSCDLMTLDYRDQVKKKEETLLQSLKGIYSSTLLPSVHSDPFYFRNKAKFSVTGTIDKPIIGLLGDTNLDSGREILSCPLHVQPINDVLPFVKEFITEAKLTPYNIENKSGELKGIILFYSRESQEMYLRFICRSKEPVTRIVKFLKNLQAKIPNLKVVSVNIQPVPHAILEGDEEIILTEAPAVHHKLGPVSMNLTPRAFVQTNQSIAKNLYETAALWVKENKTDRFLELFCGQGAFSFFCAENIHAGLGIEINPEAILEAIRTAKKKGLTHLNFKSADAGKIGHEIKEFSPDLILVNPPRRGLGDSLKLLLEEKPQTIIYSSCSHESLGADLQKLKCHYEITRAQIFDMFPQTEHFETLVELHRL